VKRGSGDEGIEDRNPGACATVVRTEGPSEGLGNGNPDAASTVAESGVVDPKKSV
jgi:hypothetical protein